LVVEVGLDWEAEMAAAAVEMEDSAEMEAEHRSTFQA